MNGRKLQATAAVTFAIAGMGSSVLAFEKHNEFIKTDTTAEMLESLDHPSAEIFSEMADIAKEERQDKLKLTVINVGGAAVCGLVAFVPGRRRPKNNKEVSGSTTPTTEA